MSLNITGPNAFDDGLYITDPYYTVDSNRVFLLDGDESTQYLGRYQSSQLTFKAKGYIGKVNTLLFKNHNLGDNGGNRLRVIASPVAISENQASGLYGLSVNVTVLDIDVTNNDDIFMLFNDPTFVLYNEYVDMTSSYHSSRILITRLAANTSDEPIAVGEIGFYVSFNYTPALNGTDVMIEDQNGDIVGQGSLTLTNGSGLVDISNKSYGDNVTYMNNKLANNQTVISGDFVYNNSDSLRKVRTDAYQGNQSTYTMTYFKNDASAETFSGSFVPSEISDSAAHGESLKTTISFKSSGIITITT